MNRNSRNSTPREQQAKAACLRRSFGRQAKLDAATAANLKELGFDEMQP